MPYRAPLYSAFFRLILRRLDPERTHRLAAAAMRALAAIPGAVTLIDRLLAPHQGRLTVRAMGLEFRSPLGLAAGVDKDVTWFGPLAALGFGSVEVGTVTARPQPGNPARPRLTRLVRDRALINAMGFPNEGAEATAMRLRGHGLGPAAGGRRGRGLPTVIVGANIGKSKAVGLDQAVDDYREAARGLAPLADYIALNVSSPNTPGLRELQSVDRLGALIDGVREEMRSVAAERPLLVKLSADLSDGEVKAIAELALERGVEGIIAVNTTTDASIAARSGAELAGQKHGGGVSGAPLRDRALQVLRLLRSETGGRVTLISVGGVESHTDVWERILAGATVVQAYTGLVYGGPLWPERVNRGLERLLSESPYSTLEEAIGKGS